MGFKNQAAAKRGGRKWWTRGGIRRCVLYRAGYGKDDYLVRRGGQASEMLEKSYEPGKVQFRRIADPHRGDHLARKQRKEGAGREKRGASRGCIAEFGFRTKNFRARGKKGGPSGEKKKRLGQDLIVATHAEVGVLLKKPRKKTGGGVGLKKKKSSLLGGIHIRVK